MLTGIERAIAWSMLDTMPTRAVLACIRFGRASAARMIAAAVRGRVGKAGA